MAVGWIKNSNNTWLNVKKRVLGSNY